MYAKWIKRAMDILLSLIGLPFFLVLFLIIAPIQLITSGRPIFYNASRVGKNGKIFKVYKFRSMRNNAPDIRREDGSTYNSADDPRLTRFGKLLRETSLDETPQLLNVLIGNMSFIGPRPDLPDHLAVYTQQQRRKLDVLPGITGYAQATFRNGGSWEDRLECDAYYAEHLTFMMDVRVLWKTVKMVLLRKGIYTQEAAEIKETAPASEKEVTVSGKAQ